MLLLLLLGVTRPLGLRKDFFSTGFVTKPKNMTLPEWSLPAAVVAQWRATPIPENQIEGLFAEKRCSHIEATRIPPFVREKKEKLWTAANLVAETL